MCHQKHHHHHLDYYYHLDTIRIDHHRSPIGYWSRSTVPVRMHDAVIIFTHIFFCVQQKFYNILLEKLKKVNFQWIFIEMLKCSSEFHWIQQSRLEVCMFVSVFSKWSVFLKICLCSICLIYCGIAFYGYIHSFYSKS